MTVRDGRGVIFDLDGVVDDLRTVDLGGIMPGRSDA